MRPPYINLIGYHLHDAHMGIPEMNVVLLNRPQVRELLIRENQCQEWQAQVGTLVLVVYGKTRAQ